MQWTLCMMTSHFLFDHQALLWRYINTETRLGAQRSGNSNGLTLSCLGPYWFILHWAIYILNWFYRICCDIAEMSTNKKEYDLAIKSYKEALSYDSSHAKV